MSEPGSLESTIAWVRGDINVALGVLEGEMSVDGVLSPYKIGEVTTAAIQTVIGRDKALAARLRQALGGKVNPCLGSHHSVRLRTDAARINDTADAINNILTEFGL